MNQSLLKLSLNSQAEMPLYKQVYEQLRQLILDGSLPHGERLPASRKLAQANSIGRITVSQAYAQLESEGFIITRRGAGSYIAESLPKSLTRKTPSKINFSTWADRAMAYSAADLRNAPQSNPNLTYDFGFGRSFPQLFPYDIWRRLLARYLSTDDTMLARYGSAAGFEPLRSALAAYLARVRGINCSAEQIIIVNGVQQAIDIIARLFVSVGDEVLVESPGYVEAYRLLKVYGAHLQGLAVDDEGLITDRLPTRSNAKLIFVTPSNQFPRGGTLPLARRLQLLDWAQHNNALILEDDYDSELRYDGRQVGALQGIDQAGRVIYLGTFSKVLFPALRLAYVVLPKSIVPQFLAAKHLVDRGSPTLTQAAIADFITEGHFDKHLRRLRGTYGERRQRLRGAIQQYLGDRVQLTDVAAGLHLMLRLQSGVDEGLLVRESAEKLSVGIYPGAPYHLKPSVPPTILLAFSAISDNLIDEGVRHLSSIL